MSHHRQLKPLHERLSPEELHRRAATTEVRRQLSLEHAKTRGYVNLALSNTQALHKMQVRMVWVGGVALMVLVIVIAAVISLWLQG